MKIKPRGKIYSLNEGYAAQFDKPLTKYLDSLKNPTVSNSKDCFNCVCSPFNLLFKKEHTTHSTLIQFSSSRNDLFIKQKSHIRPIFVRPNYSSTFTIILFRILISIPSLYLGNVVRYLSFFFRVTRKHMVLVTLDPW